MHEHKNPLNLDIPGALLFHRLRRSDIVDAINAHLVAVHSDEAQFNDAGVAIDDAAVEETHAVEVKHFNALIRTPCQSPEDVQAKLRYILHGTVGDRDELLTCLTIPEYAGDRGWEDFLRSLLVPTHAHTHEQA
jgi:hypothetical protein